MGQNRLRTQMSKSVIVRDDHNYFYEKKTYRKRLEKDQALYDAFHGITRQAESGAQMAPAFSD